MQLWMCKRFVYMICKWRKLTAKYILKIPQPFLRKRGRHDSSVDFDGFWWAVVYQKDDNYCCGLKAQAWCSIYEQTAIKQTWLEVEEVSKISSELNIGDWANTTECH